MGIMLRHDGIVVLVVQVSDQLVEINGDSTSGMTHSQAVEQIRKGGTRIHLVLKKGNGYVPDYGEEGNQMMIVDRFCLFYEYSVLGRCVFFYFVRSLMKTSPFWPSNLFLLMFFLFFCFTTSSIFFPPPVELSSLSLCMTNSKQGEPCFYVIGRTENSRLVTVP